MLQVARLAPRLLQEASRPVADFLRAEFNQDGGVRDRAGKSDLYYTVFGLDSLAALDAELPVEESQSFLLGFGDGEGLDLVHTACLARAWAALRPASPGPETVRGILRRIERFRTPDGGYGGTIGAQRGTAYHSFLALDAYQDLGAEMPAPQGLPACLAELESADGAFSNSPALPAGSTTATAAAVAILRQVNSPVPSRIQDWLLQRLHPQGGFLATPDAPIPDLLSTAAALHALTSLGMDLAPLKESCLDFLDSLWTGRTFCGNWTDGTADSEYTYYGLLSLGHLSL